MMLFCFLMIRRPPRSTLDRSSAASDVYKRQDEQIRDEKRNLERALSENDSLNMNFNGVNLFIEALSLIHISEPTRPY